MTLSTTTTSPTSPPAASNVGELPRLLYLGDVPVRSTLAGAALVYRLLMTYPVDRLRVWESNLPPEMGPKLDGVEYTIFRAVNRRLLRTRFAAWYGGHLLSTARAKGKRLARRIARQSWRPQAVLTVAHTYSWLSAAEVADRLQLPLHLIIHDDPKATVAMPPEMRDDFTRWFGDVYRGARSRLCVSPYMAEAFAAEFRVAGDVVYPLRAPNSLSFEQPPERLGKPSPQLTFAYAGSLMSEAYRQMVKTLAEVARDRGHRLLVYSDLPVETISALGLDRPHVKVSPTIPFTELIRVLREQVDVLFVPMSFEPGDRRNMEISFPSKLTDYTAAGLPLLICGPEYASAVRWAKANPGVAELAAQPDAASLAASIERLSEAPYRVQLAEAAIAVGKKYFSHERVVATFLKHLRVVPRPSAIS